MESSLKKIYYDVKHPASYGTVNKLWSATQGKYAKKSIAAWLRSQDANTIHKQRKLRFTRSRYYVPTMNNLFQCDLCDMRSLEKYNNGYKFILTLIDVFCKKAFAVALKDKSADTVLQALHSIFKQRKPLYLQSDKGKEFINSKLQNYLKNNGIQFYTTNNPDTKASVIEKCTRCLLTHQAFIMLRF
jgi:hypothetical protein